MSHRALGTGSGHAADGAHTHSGVYASTSHGSTHDNDGSDPITTLNAFQVDHNDGTGYIEFKKSDSDVAAPADTTWQRWHVRSIAGYPMQYIRALSRRIPMDAIFGPANRFAVFPNTGTSPSAMFGPAPTVTNLTHPTATTANGVHFNIASTAAINTRGNIDSHLGWFRGDSNVYPWAGGLLRFRSCFPDASYANSGASTGTRSLWGWSDLASSTLDNTDNPSGSRFCFEYVNVNGGRVQTTFNVTLRDNGGTENVIDTTITPVQNKWYDFWLFMYPWGECGWQIDDVVAQTVLAAGTTTTGIPGETTIMRINATMRTINAVARNMKLQSIIAGCMAV